MMSQLTEQVKYQMTMPQAAASNGLGAICKNFEEKYAIQDLQDAGQCFLVGDVSPPRADGGRDMFKGEGGDRCDDFGQSECS